MSGTYLVTFNTTMYQPNFYLHFPDINGEWVEPPAQDKRDILKMLAGIKGLPPSFSRNVEKLYNTAPANTDIAWIVQGSKHSLAFYHKQSNTLFPIPAKFLYS